MSRRRLKPSDLPEQNPETNLSVGRIEITQAEANAAAESLGCAKLRPATLKALAILGFQVEGVGAYRTVHGEVLTARHKLVNFLDKIFEHAEKENVTFEQLMESGPVVAMLNKALTESHRLSLDLVRQQHGGFVQPPAAPPTGASQSFPAGTTIVADKVMVQSGPISFQPSEKAVASEERKG